MKATALQHQQKLLFYHLCLKRDFILSQRSQNQDSVVGLLPMTGLIQGIDHLEFYVGNAKQTAKYFSLCFGFTVTAYLGLETGERKTTSYVLEQGDIRFVISSALCPDHPIAKSVMQHGDTIAVVAMTVMDVAGTYHYAIARGATGAIPPTRQANAQGVLYYAAIHGFGNLLIKFIDRRDYAGTFAPGFVAHDSTPAPAMGLTNIDHIVGNVELGQMDRWTEFFIQTMGYRVQRHFDDQSISSAYSALMSKVLQNGTQTTFNINEPAIGKRKSQIDEYLEFHHGPGIQHIGLTTENIVETVTQLRKTGVEFLTIPETYYDNLQDWVQDIGIPITQLAELGILVDRDEAGYLLQLFTKPIGDRPTLFFEIIQRCGAKGFGAGNFKSLFVALEQEQARRGNL